MPNENILKYNPDITNGSSFSYSKLRIPDIEDLEDRLLLMSFKFSMIEDEKKQAEKQKQYQFWASQSCFSHQDILRIIS